MLFATAVGIAPNAVAQQQSPLEIRLEVLKPGPVVEDRPTWVEATDAEPGQILVYRGTYRNRGSGELKNVVVVLPVPEEMAYIAGSAKPAAVEASIDRKTFFVIATPPKDTEPSAWKELRWSPLTLAPGAEIVVEVRAQVPAASR